jgi:hypothetical protein
VTLREKQSLFALKVSHLISHVGNMGLAVTLGEAYRSPEEAARLAKLGKGIKASLHTQRLAIDLNFFRDGKFLTRSEDYAIAGTWWEMQSFDDVQFCWGGRFNDGNHFSISHGGRK